MKNNPWKKPELVVLTRSTPEEGVLTSCKVLGQSGASVAVGDCGIVDCSAECDTHSIS